MDNLIKDRLFYDFYKELLTNHQREVLDLYYNEDLSLAEIAQRLGSSRQAIYDIVKRSAKSLNNYESKLHLVSNEINREKKYNEIIKNLKTILGKEEISSNSKEVILQSIHDLRG